MNRIINNSEDFEVRLGRHDVSKEMFDDGSMILRNEDALEPIENTMLDCLDFWAEKAPNTVFLRERTPDGWNEVSYSKFHSSIYEMAAHLATLDISQDKPLLIVAPNSINHALVAFASMLIGAPVTPVSIAYATLGETFSRLENIIETVQPGAIYFSDTILFDRAINALSAKLDIPFVSTHSTRDDVKNIRELDSVEEDIVLAKRSEITPKTTCKIMMTSGSTGMPKGVINTHEMMYSNQAAVYKMWPFLEDMPPNLVDWLPWSHTFGGNCVLNMVIYNGGTMTIDDGKPIPAQIGRTVENISLNKPNIQFNVPVGYEGLLAQMENNRAFAKKYFESVKVLFVAAAPLSDAIRNKIISLATELVGKPPKFIAGYGSTETAPFSTCLNFETEIATNLGVPLPGTEVKLVPVQGKMAINVKGPNVTPGYWRNEEATKSAFDADGFYSIGDAGELINPDDPSEGLVFAGRISENFKLSSGTWVNVNQVRVALVAALKPLVTDAVITGHNQKGIGALVIPNLAYLSEKYQLDKSQQTADHLQTVDAFIQELTEKVIRYSEENSTGSTSVKRFALLPNPPSVEKNEITDKGYLNQRALLENYNGLVEALQAEEQKKPVTFYKF